MKQIAEREKREYKIYNYNCEKYNEIIETFKELGSGELSKNEVLNKVELLVNNGLIERLKHTIKNIEIYEKWYY